MSYLSNPLEGFGKIAQVSPCTGSSSTHRSHFLCSFFRSLKSTVFDFGGREGEIRSFHEQFDAREVAVER